MIIDLTGRRALVTGGADRIGRAVALALARQGADIVIHYNTSAEEAEKTAGDIRGCGVESMTVRANLADRREAAALMPRVLETAGVVDILVNNAAVFGISRLGALDMDDFDATLAINAVAPLLLMEAFSRQNLNGVVVNFLDSRVESYDTERAGYQLSKNMLRDLTLMGAVTFAPRIRVNAVAPGVILSPPGAGDDVADRLGRRTPMGRRGTLKDIADAVLFLVGHDYLTGEILHVDGGLGIGRWTVGGERS